MDGGPDLERLPIIGAATVARLLPYGDLVDALEAGHRQPAASVRRIVFGPEGGDASFLALPAWGPAGPLGVKLVTVFPANTAGPSVQALYVLFDGEDGSPVALIDGTELTYRKTACDSALGSRLLSRVDARTLLMVGAGGLAPHLVAAHRAVRPSIERVLLWNRTTAAGRGHRRLAGGRGGRRAGRGGRPGRCRVHRHHDHDAPDRGPVATAGHPPRPGRRLPPRSSGGGRRGRGCAPSSTSTPGR